MIYIILSLLYETLLMFRYITMANKHVTLTFHKSYQQTTILQIYNPVCDLRIWKPVAIGPPGFQKPNENPMAQIVFHKSLRCNQGSIFAPIHHLKPHICADETTLTLSKQQSQCRNDIRRWSFKFCFISWSASAEARAIIFTGASYEM